MAKFEVTAPDGKKFEITAPEGATQEQVLAYAKEQFSKQPTAEPSPEASMGDRVARQAGLGVRHAVEGAAGLPLLVGDALNELYNLAVAGIEKVTPAKDLPRLGKASDYVRGLLTKAGLPEPQGAAEEVAGAAIRGMYGATPMVAAGRAVPAAAALAQQPTMQAVSGATGGASAELAEEAGAGPVGQTVAGVAGALAPSVVPAASKAAVRGAVRGGEAGRQEMLRRTETFQTAGAEPSVGQASGNRLVQATESGLAKIPGSAGVMARAATNQADDFGANVQQIADDLSPKATATKAGVSIEKGIKEFVGDFKTKQTSLYSNLDRHIPKDRAVDTTNTINVLAKLNADIPGAPELSKFFKNSTIQGIESALKSDTQDFTTRLPYEALKKLRTLVGAELENTSLTSSVPRSKWKELYAALSDDLAQAAKEGSPAAERAFRRANTYSRAGHDRIGTFLDRVAGKDTVEKIFQAAVNPSELKEGASTINAVMRSIEPENRKVVQAALIKRLGTANPSNQNELGEIFSSETFLTNWNKMSGEAKRTLFAGSKGNQLRTSLDKVAEAASMVRDGSKVFSNPSGTSQATANVGGAVALAASVGTGNLATAATLLAGAGVANLSAKLLTNPNFVGWLAKTTEINPAALPSSLNALVHSVQDGDPETRREVGRYVNSVRSQLPRSEAQQPQTLRREARKAQSGSVNP